MILRNFNINFDLKHKSKNRCLHKTKNTNSKISNNIIITQRTHVQIFRKMNFSWVNVIFYNVFPLLMFIILKIHKDILKK